MAGCIYQCLNLDHELEKLLSWQQNKEGALAYKDSKQEAECGETVQPEKLNPKPFQAELFQKKERPSEGKATATNRSFSFLFLLGGSPNKTDKYLHSNYSSSLQKDRKKDNNLTDGMVLPGGTCSLSCEGTTWYLCYVEEWQLVISLLSSVQHKVPNQACHSLPQQTNKRVGRGGHIKKKKETKDIDFPLQQSSGTHIILHTSLINTWHQRQYQAAGQKERENLHSSKTSVVPHVPYKLQEDFDSSSERPRSRLGKTVKVRTTERETESGVSLDLVDIAEYKAGDRGRMRVPSVQCLIGRPWGKAVIPRRKKPSDKDFNPQSNCGPAVILQGLIHFNRPIHRSPISTLRPIFLPSEFNNLPLLLASSATHISIPCLQIITVGDLLHSNDYYWQDYMGENEGGREGRKDSRNDSRKEGRIPGRKAGFQEGRKGSRKEGSREGGKEGFQEGRIPGRKEGRKDSRKEGRREGRIPGRKEGEKEGGKEGRREGRKGSRKEGSIQEGRIPGRKDSRKEGRIPGRIPGRKDSRKEGFQEGFQEGREDSRKEASDLAEITSYRNEKIMSSEFKHSILSCLKEVVSGFTLVFFNAVCFKVYGFPAVVGIIRLQPPELMKKSPICLRSASATVEGVKSGSKDSIALKQNVLLEKVAFDCLKSRTHTETGSKDCGVCALDARHALISEMKKLRNGSDAAKNVYHSLSVCMDEAFCLEKHTGPEILLPWAF
ncbi:hypothetical protein IHE44_0011328 [Lamprotornis superbus]|uniref:Octapeptide-repeat protein T2 n=1 Tax=Lamprotornis superbus TaxID=245042 RepID=A0A835TVG5_9PASS|nr:hypothetical protein IHE44_0011328 [Lamprotornis superbus]